MRKISLIPFLFFFVFTGCMTTYSEKEEIAVNKNDIPDSNFAYVLTTTQGKVGIVKTAVMLRDEEKEKITINLEKNEETKLFKIKPGIYSNDFHVYVWDVFYWSKTGEYNVRDSFKEPFTIEKNKVYYIGKFDSERFSFDENHMQILQGNYPNFSDMEIVLGYNLKDINF